MSTCSVAADSWSEEKGLIFAVQMRPNLFNCTFKDYTDFGAREISWRSVSEEIKMPVDECTKLWKKIRDKYVKMLRKHDPSGSSAEDAEEQWELFPLLGFLRPYLRRRGKRGNVSKWTTLTAELNTSSVSCTEIEDSPIIIKDEPYEIVEAAYDNDARFSTDLTGIDHRTMKRTLEPDEFEEEVLSAPKKSSPLSTSNRDFLLSLLPYLDSLDHKDCSTAKLKMMSMLHDMVFNQ